MPIGYLVFLAWLSSYNNTALEIAIWQAYGIILLPKTCYGFAMCSNFYLTCLPIGLLQLGHGLQLSRFAIYGIPLMNLTCCEIRFVLFGPDGRGEVEPYQPRLVLTTSLPMLLIN
jgi:hypothetical protein